MLKKEQVMTTSLESEWHLISAGEIFVLEMDECFYSITRTYIAKRDIDLAEEIENAQLRMREKGLSWAHIFDSTAHILVTNIYTQTGVLIRAQGVAVKSINVVRLMEALNQKRQLYDPDYNFGRY